MMRSGLRHALVNSTARQPSHSVGGYQRRAMSLNPFASNKEAPVEATPVQVQAPTADDPFAALSAAEKMQREEEQIQRLIDEDTRYQEPDMTFFESVDSYWELFLSVASPLRWADNMMHSMHDTLGLEWWACILAASFGVRLLMLPLQLFTTRNQIRMSLYQPEMQLIKANKQKATSNSSLSEKDKALVKNNYDAQLAALAQKGGYKESYSFLALGAVIPYGVIFYSTRGVMAETAVVEAQGGGCLWFPIITNMDPTYILPLMAWVGMAAGSELNLAQASPVKSKYYFLQKWGTRVMSGAFLFMFSSSPAGVMIGFVGSGVMGCVPPLLLRSEKVRRLLKVPKLKTPPRSTMNTELTGMRGVSRKIRAWMAGATFEKTAVLGGGVGSMAHAVPSSVKNVSEFKVRTKR